MLKQLQQTQQQGGNHNGALHQMSPTAQILQQISTSPGGMNAGNGYAMQMGSHDGRLQSNAISHGQPHSPPLTGSFDNGNNQKQVLTINGQQVIVDSLNLGGGNNGARSSVGASSMTGQDMRNSMSGANSP